MIINTETPDQPEVRDYGTADGEIKRMFVDERRRGQGTGGRLLDHLVMFARMAGLSVLRLETGIHQPDAIALYERAGFVRRAPFGAYEEDPLSIFMEKPL